MNSILRHVRPAVRMLLATPVFTITAVASLAIGIGANTAIFTAANAIFLAPTAGVTEPSRLIDIGRTLDGRGFDTVSYVTYEDLRDRDSVFRGVYAIRMEPEPLSLGTEGGAERIYGQQVSANYFHVLGLQPAAGQFFEAAGDRVGVPLRKIVLGHAFWTSRFAAQPDIVGTEIVLNGDAFTVAAVAPQGYRGSTVLAPDIWVPLTSLGRGLMAESTLRGRENNGLLRPVTRRGRTVATTPVGHSGRRTRGIRAHGPARWRRHGSGPTAAAGHRGP